MRKSLVGRQAHSQFFNLTIPAPGEVVEGFSGRDENGGDEDMGPPPKPTDEELAQAEEVYQRAVEMYNNDEFLDAVDLFSQSVEVMSAYHYGDETNNKKLAKPYFYYGDCLLKAAINRSNFLNDPEIEKRIEECLAEDENNNNSNETNESGGSNNGEKENIENNESNELNKEDDNLVFATEENDLDENEKVDNVKEDNEKEDNEKEDKENEDSDMSDSDVELPFDVNEELEVAWEVLEISRVLHAKEDDPDLESLSNVHFSLANVALESNNIEGATKEFEECLNLRKKKFGEDSRDVAEVYYMMGVILMYSKDHFEISKKKSRNGSRNIEKVS